MLLSMTCIAQRQLFKCENCKQTASHSSTLPREDRALQRTSHSNHSTYLQSHHPCSMEHLSRPASRTQNRSSMRRDCSFSRSTERAILLHTAYLLFQQLIRLSVIQLINTTQRTVCFKRLHLFELYYLHV